MRSIIPLDELQKKMSAISSVVPGKSTMPILSMVLINAVEKKLTFSATDLDISVTSNITGEIESEGAIAAPARKITEIVKSLTGDDVVFETRGENLTIICGRSRFDINGRSAEEFPKLPKQKSESSFTIDIGLLEKMIQKTTYAVSTDLTRPALCGVLWKLGPDGMTMVSTDGHRLAKLQIKKDMGSMEDADVIIPPKALSTLRNFSGGEDEAKVNLAENSLSFNMKGVVVFSRLLEGPFPDFTKVIPTGNKKKMVVSTEELMAATKRVSILSDSLTHLVVFSLQKGKLLLNVTTKEVGGAKEEIDAEYSEDPMEIGYNANYIQDIMRTMESDRVVFHLDRPDNAGMIVPESEDKDYDHICIIMPLRIS